MQSNGNLPAKQSHGAWLTSELERLDTLLRPAPDSIIAERMKILFAALPAQECEGGEGLRAQAYLYALDGVSRTSLDGVVRDILQGRLSTISLTFAPTPPELSRLCRDRDAAIRVERAKREAEMQAASQPRPAEPTKAELQRRAEKAAAASLLVDAWIAEKDLRQTMVTRRREDQRSAEARERAAELVPMTDDEIAALQVELERAA